LQSALAPNIQNDPSMTAHRQQRRKAGLMTPEIRRSVRRSPRQAAALFPQSRTHPPFHP
jgi:hypothetical protein